MSVQPDLQPTTTSTVERHETIIIGGGQAGLAMAYHLAQLGLPFVILDANERIGDGWRARWESMRLFTPARRDGLPGRPFPARKHSFPTKDEMATYLEDYSAHFELPVRTGIRVDALGLADDGRFLIAAGERRYSADHVVVATGPFQRTHVPVFARELDPRITHMHSSTYQSPGDLPDGDVLVVGAGNSGADIALELAADRHVWLSGDLGPEIPFNIEGTAGRFVFPVLWQVWSHVLTFGSPVGRKALPKIRAGMEPRIRVKKKDLAAAGVEFVPRTAGVRNGQPLLDDGRVLDVAAVIWATGYRPALDWIDLPAIGDDGELATDHHGAVPSHPGLYRVGREFLYAFNSHTVGGVGRDAKRIAQQIEARVASVQEVPRLADGDRQRGHVEDAANA
jgi:putative flavoprotein involved in K+ transport